MTRDAEKHLSKARSYLAKGEEFYRKAAEEIIAAQKADHTLSNREICEWFGRSEKWVREIVKWSTTAEGTPNLPFSEEKGAVAQRHTRNVLAKAPLEQVEQIISELPAERQQAVAAAAGHEYLKARLEHDEKERSLTPQERGRREAAAEALTLPARKAAAGFATLGIVGHIEQATEELRELVADASVTVEHVQAIDSALALLTEELEVARGVAGLSEEVEV